MNVGKLIKNDPVKVREEIINRIVGIILESIQETSIRPSSTFNGHPNLTPALAYIHSVINSKL